MRDSKKLLFLASIYLVLLAYPKVSYACNYKATIIGNHVDFEITSDIDKLAVIQYIRLSGSALVTKMYGADIGIPWTYFDDFFCNVYVSYPIGCRQNRGGELGTGAFWQWSTNGGFPYHTLPAENWGLDFDMAPSYESLGIEYGTTGGGEAWTFCSRTGEVTPPTPISTPTPIPPAPTPTPVSKVVFIPGLGASWNASAFANCSFDEKTEDWSLAPYAEDIYNPILAALSSSGWDTKPFYYDWKNNVQNNSNSLAKFLSSSSANNEKVDIVGHSMGGLVGMDYLIGNPNKIEKILTAGSPFKGSVLAYPTWEAGDIWQDNFIEKIAATLLLKHCASIHGTNTDKDTIYTYFPSIGDLLPTFNYLSNFKTHEFIDPKYAKNTWSNVGHTIPTDPIVETLSGIGFDTLSNLQVKPANKHEESLNIWVDGKPAGKIYSTQGDGTVLAESSSIEGAENVSITQTHSGLVDSIEGMTEILRFLGNSPDPNVSLQNTSTEPKAALVVIGYPANFVVTDQDGNYKKAKDGMVSFINPKTGSYKLNLLPRSNNTLLVVAQFLPNGNVKYKEYKLQGFGPKFENLNFNLQNPQEDILN
jgi:pimeloyl-ACP methyl ester carboxylesterase